jgi:hypothetical protein
MARPIGRLSCAAVAAPPSPLEPAVPVPANRLIAPAQPVLTTWLELGLVQVARVDWVT